MVKDDSAKDASVALIGAAGAALSLTGGAAAVVAAAGGLLAIGWDRVGSRNRRRAQEMLQRLLEADKNPEELHSLINEGLISEDERVMSAFRALLVASVESVSPAAIAPIAVIGRMHFRGECATWIARGALEVLQRVDSIELGALRRMLLEFETIKSDRIMITAELSSDRGWRAYQSSVPDDLHPITPFPSARRIFGYLKRAGLGTDTSAYGIGGSPEVVEIERIVTDALRKALVP